MQDAAAYVLKDEGKPLHAKEITRRIIDLDLWSSDSKTPDATVAARLYREIQKYGDRSTFVQTAAATFSLRKVQPAAVDDVNQETSTMRRQDEPAADSAPPTDQGMSFLEAAAVLDTCADKKPMHYREIVDQAISRGLLVTSGKTPDASMNAQLTTQIKRAKRSGESCRFFRHSRGCYGLVEWLGTGLSYKISNHNIAIRKKLLARLMDLTPAQFEELVTLLLRGMGFEDIELTQYGSDGGIDVRGTLVIGDVVRIKMAVQAKRWKANVQSPTVQQVRGSLGVHEQGLIITTSKFSPGAIKEASQPNKTPVALMDGEQLVKLLLEYDIGVRRESYDIFELDALELAPA